MDEELKSENNPPEETKKERKVEKKANKKHLHKIIKSAIILPDKGVKRMETFFWRFLSSYTAFCRLSRMKSKD